MGDKMSVEKKYNKTSKKIKVTLRVEEKAAQGRAAFLGFYAKIRSWRTISSAREWMLFMARTKAIWSRALKDKVVSEVVDPCDGQSVLEVIQVQIAFLSFQSSRLLPALL